MPKFFITGLPRSRTAWCANFLTSGDSFCWHDGLANCRSLDEFEKRMEAATLCGDSDSGLVFFYDELRERYRDAQWAIVRRPAEEVVRSLLAMEPYEGIPAITEADARALVENASERLEKIALDPRVLSLSASDLSTREGARALWWHCLRDRSPWNDARWQQLRDMNVTVRSGDIALSLATAAQLFGKEAA